MSLHRETTYCENHDGCVEWVGACSCGWQHDEWVSSGRGADSSHDAYRKHVEGALGPDAYLTVPVACRNCGSRHEQGILVGTHTMCNACQRCGTTMLEPDNEAWHDSRENSRRWML